MKNMTMVTEFNLLGFSIFSHLRVLVFCLIFLSYFLTIIGNTLIISLVLSDAKLQRPMYFFLVNLAVIDICFINTTVPNLLKDIWWESKSIYLTHCLAQMFFFFLAGTAEFLHLAVMSVDRYLAICHPLHYSALMKSKVCIWLTAGVWLGSFFAICGSCFLVMRLSFCFSDIDHFFCDIGPLLRNSCTSTRLIERLVFASSSLLIVSFVITVLSYGNIIITVVKLKTREGKHRVFSTCSSHALVVSIAYGTCIFMYFQPTVSQGPSINKEVSILNTIVLPLVNPFIYTLRNQDMKRAIHEMYPKLDKNMCSGIM